MTDTTRGLTTRTEPTKSEHCTNATIDARHLIDPTNNRVTVLGTMDKDYRWVRFSDGTENAFPTEAVTLDAPDLAAQVTAPKPSSANGPFELGDRVTGRSLLNDATVTGTYLRSTGDSGDGLLVDCGDESRDIIAADSTHSAEPTLADSLRQLADVIDQHPEIADSFAFPRFVEHQFGPRAANVDSFAKAFGVIPEHKIHKDDGRYTTAETTIGLLTVKAQATTGDYEAATGTRIPRLHQMAESCWCEPRYENGAIVHHDAAGPVFASTDTDPIDANGYATEDHR